MNQGCDPCYSKDVPKVTSKLQLTVPKAIADRYGIRAGDELEWIPAGESIRVIPAGKTPDERVLSLQERLDLFDKASQRQRHREVTLHKVGHTVKARERGWSREDLYDRGLSD